MTEERIPKYYSQYGEDYLLWQFFDHKSTGFYVDVGAFDGVFLSNTFLFEQQGWSGICIEPHPTYFQLCQQARLHAICLNLSCIASDYFQTAEFYAEGIGLWSGVCGDREDDVRNRYKKQGLKFGSFDRMMLPASTLNIILGEYLPYGTEIDFVSIDVEGTEIEVLQGFDLPRFRPRVIVVEANSIEDRVALDTHLIKYGYSRAGELEINAFYVREYRDAKRLRNISIDCMIEECAHPLCEEYTLPEESGIIHGRRLIWGNRRRKKRFSLKRKWSKFKTMFRKLGANLI